MSKTPNMKKQYKAELRDLERQLNREEKNHQAEINKSHQLCAKISKAHEKAVKKMEVSVQRLLRHENRKRLKLIKSFSPVTVGITNRIALLRQRLES